MPDPLSFGSGEFLALEYPAAYWLEQHGYEVRVQIFLLPLATSAILYVKCICVALPRPGMSHYRSHTAPTLTSSALPSAVNAILPRTATVVAAFGVLSRHSYQWAMTSTGTRASTTAFKHSVMRTASRCFSLVATPYAGSLPCRPTSE